MEYSNAQKLAAVVSEWARPAISQIASSRLVRLPFIQSLQTAIQGSGMVGEGYNIANDLEPMMQPIVNSLITPMLTQYISSIPDENIPQMARSLVDKMKQQGTFSILDGLVTFEPQDIAELDQLLMKNIPVEHTEGYQVIH